MNSEGRRFRETLVLCESSSAAETEDEGVSQTFFRGKTNTASGAPSAMEGISARRATTMSPAVYPLSDDVSFRPFKEEDLFLAIFSVPKKNSLDWFEPVG